MEKSLKSIISWVMIISLVLLGFPTLPSLMAQTSLTEASATISDSAPGATGVTYQFDFTTAVNLVAGETIDITFPADYTGLLPAAGNVTCPVNSTSSVVGLVITCTVDAGQTVVAGALTVTAAGVENPAKVAAEGIADVYRIDIETDGDEKAQVMVAIIETVVVTATVDATLSFTISGVTTTTVVKNTTTTVGSTTTTIPFGVLPIGSSVVAAQDLKVATNASEGYTVVVFQDRDLTSAAADTIKCFEEAVCVPVTSTVAWDFPTGILDDIDTYGHFGFTSEDQGIAVTCQDPAFGTGYFGLKAADLWAGFNGTDQAIVMCHTGPADGTTEHKGATRVGYQIEITALQQAGEYTNTLTYIATPTY